MNPARKPILVIAGDAGGAAALLPVISALANRRHDLHVLAYGAASQIWLKAGLAYRELPASNVNPGKILRQLTPGLLLTGTSMNGIDWEKQFISAARREAVPSLALLDFWSNYRERFSDDSGRLQYLPGRIAVMDETARAQMIALGFGADGLVVTGQPAFDCLAAVRRRATVEFRNNLRSSLNLSHEKAVLFCSQPITRLYGAHEAEPRFIGYTEDSVLRALTTALESLAAKRPQSITLLIRPHPQETDYKAPLPRNGVEIRLATQPDELEIALAVDVVVGMRSILLLKAALLGCKVLSFQPGLRGPDPLPNQRLGLGVSIYDAAALEPALEVLLFGSATAPDVSRAWDRLPPHATERVVDLVEMMLESKYELSRQAGH